MSSQDSPTVSGRPVAASYARKSDDDDAGIESQHSTNARAAEGDGYHIPEGPNFRFEDNHVSGASSDRNGLDSIIDMSLSDHTPFTRLYVRDVTRWGRWDDPRERYFFEKLLERHGVTIHYVNGVNVNLSGGVTAANIGDLIVDFIDSSTRGICR